MKEEEISSKIVFEGKNFRITEKEVELPNGKRAFREVSETKFSTVAVLALDDAQNIYLVKNFRTGVSRERLEIPGGRFYPEQGEGPEEAAVRECREEVGMEPKKLELLFEIYGGGTWVSHSYYYFGTDLVKNPLEGDWDELIEIVKIPFREYLMKLLEDKSYEGRGSEFKAAFLVAKKLGLIELK